MPSVVKGDQDQDVQQAEIDRLRRAVESDNLDQLVWSPDSAAPAGKMWAWDMVDGTHTLISTATFSTPPFQGRIAALEKMVSKCSGCTYTAAKGEHDSQLVTEHVKRVQEEAKAHEHAEAREMPGEKGGYRCSACATTFVSRPMNVYKHIQQAQEAGPLHVGATEVVMKRFSLTPPVQQEVATPVAVPVTLEPETRQASRSRNRNRRRSRGRHRGVSA